MTTQKMYNVYAVLRDQHGNGTPIAKINKRRMCRERAESAVSKLLKEKGAIRALAIKA